MISIIEVVTQIIKFLVEILNIYSKNNYFESSAAAKINNAIFSVFC